MNVLKTIGKALGYTLLYLVFTALFIVWTFPEERLATFAEAKAAKFNNLDVSIGELELEGIDGVTLSNVTVRLPKKAKEPMPGMAPEKDDRPGGILQVGRLAVDASLWDYFVGGIVQAEFEGEMYTAEVPLALTSSDLDLIDLVLSAHVLSAGEEITYDVFGYDSFGNAV